MRRDTPKSRAFVQRGREASAKSLSRARFPRRPKRRTELDREEARAALIFGQTVRAERRCCQVCGYRGFFVEAHHVVKAQLLRRLLNQKREPCPPSVLFDPRNGLLLCTDAAHAHERQGCHSKHTGARRRIPRSALRPENWAFAREHGLEWVLVTEYPETQAA